MKNEKIDKHLNIILSITVIFLSLTLVFSNIGKNKTDKRKKISTALLNPKYITELNEFELTGTGAEKIYLQKKNNIWLVKSDKNGYEIPANQKTVSDFINNLSEIIKLYKISDLSEKNYKVLFPENLSFSVKYKYADNMTTTLLFGKYDFSQNFRYLMTEKTTSVYEINTQLDRFLSTNYQIWAEPDLISKNVLGKIDNSSIQRLIFSENNESTKILNSDTQNFEEIKRQLLELRHGGNFRKEVIINTLPDSKLKIELGDKKDIFLDFYFIQENDEYNYLVKIYYDNVAIFNYKISLWTYNKIREMML